MEKQRNIYFYHRNFTFGETSLVIDKLHFPQENFTCNANFTIDRCPFQEILRVFSNPLNDRTSLEMTFFEDRHFDQVKRVEKSPNAKQGYVLNELMLGIMN